MFGPNASLDVSGLFDVSTADELRLADGDRFSVINPQTNGLSIAAPMSFGFLGADCAGIIISGSQLSVGEGENLSGDAGQLNDLAADGAADANLETRELSDAHRRRRLHGR